MRISTWLSSLLVFFVLMALSPSSKVFSAEPKTPTSMTFSGQMAAICSELLEVTGKDPKFKDRKVKLANVVAANLTDSNFNLRVEEELKTRLAEILAPKADFLLSGELDYLESSTEDNLGFKVIQLTIKIVDGKRSELVKLVREVNDTGDIARILQLTIAPPDTTDYAKRNAEAAKVEQAPEFALVPGSKTQVTAVNFPRYAMELRRHENGKGPAIAVEPKNEKGLAFAPIGIGDTYEVVLYNYDEESDAVAKIEIDGLDVVNTFNSDKTPDGRKQEYPGYFIPHAVNGKPGQHVISGWLNTVKPSKENVFKFIVNKLGEGVASQLNVKSNKTGFVTATFFDACEPNGKLRSRNFGETGKGEGMRVDYELKPVQVAKVPLSIVSIRYSRSPEK